MKSFAPPIVSKSGGKLENWRKRRFSRGISLILRFFYLNHSNALWNLSLVNMVNE
jgi:hypothetical protein